MTKEIDDVYRTTDVDVDGPPKPWRGLFKIWIVKRPDGMFVPWVKCPNGESRPLSHIRRSRTEEDAEAVAARWIDDHPRGPEFWDRFGHEMNPTIEQLNKL